MAMAAWDFPITSIHLLEHLLSNMGTGGEEMVVSLSLGPLFAGVPGAPALAGMNGNL